MAILTLKQHHLETTDIDSFIFESDEQINFSPGQYLQFTLPHNNPDNRGIKRYFTIASAPSEGVIQITTRFAEKSSSFKAALRAIQPGHIIQTGPPSGDFTYPNPTHPAVFIAGGIGITPYRSVLVELDSKGIDAPVTLLYANRTNDIAFKDLFDQMAAKHPSFKVIYIIDPEKLDADYIRKHVPDLTVPRFYMSGPESMVEAFSKMFISELNISRDRLEHDFFPGYSEF